MAAKVRISSCPTYDVEKIRSLTVAALDDLGLVPRGRVLVKPNVVVAGDLFPHAFTRAEFTEGVLLALKDRGEDVTELAVGERCGITMPTRYAFKEADYYKMARRVGAALHHFDETRQVEIPMYHEGRLRDSLFTPEPVAAADFFVNCPKFKAHPWTTVTFSMKNYIGIQDDRHRLIDHDHLLDTKVADLQYITQPQLIAIDAIIAGEGRMLTPLPFDLGLVMFGNNQVAFDVVCCHIIGIDPMSVEHIRLAHERGFGPASLDEIEITGDVSLDAAREKASGFRSGLIRVEDYFAETHIRAYGGQPPGEHDYCWGGCPGALEEAIEILRVIDHRTDTKMPRTHIVFGKYDGKIDAKPDEKVFFIGDCAEYHGDIGGQTVQIGSVYVDRSEKSPLAAKDEDIFVKMFKTNVSMMRSRGQVTRLQGCPVSVAEHVLALAAHGGLKNPFLDMRIAVPFMSSYLSKNVRTIFRRLAGQPYNVPGPALRGGARPPLSLPPPGESGPLERS